MIGRGWERGVWNQEGHERFRQKVGELQGKGWAEEEKVKKALKETELELGKEKGKRTGWWDEECRRKKKEVRRELRRWRRGRGNEVEHKEANGNIRNCVQRKERRRMKDGRGRQRR